MRQPITEYKEEHHQFAEHYDQEEPAPKPGVMWIYFEDGKPVAVNFLCPCGCGSECYTPLGMNSPRHWEYEQGPNGPTLKPSIRFTGGCMAHFTITDGKVKMC